MQNILNVKTMNLRKQIFLPRMWKYFVCKNQFTQNFKEK